MNPVMMYVLVFMLLSAGTSPVFADDLPVCSNRIINEVTRRAGCTLGDAKCWFRNGGFCTDYIQKRSGRTQLLKPAEWQPVNPDQVRPGDVAQFNSRAHYAYIESVVKDKQGRLAAVNVSEYNYGTCWVDTDFLVTNTYKSVTKRTNIPLNSVDGGFWRP